MKVSAREAPQLTHLSLHHRMPRNSAVENGTRVPRVSTSNISAGQSDAANKYVPIVVVVLAIGCANPVTKNMLWRS